MCFIGIVGTAISVTEAVIAAFDEGGSQRFCAETGRMVPVASLSATLDEEEPVIPDADCFAHTVLDVEDLIGDILAADETEAQGYLHIDGHLDEVVAATKADQDFDVEGWWLPCWMQSAEYERAHLSVVRYE